MILEISSFSLWKMSNLIRSPKSGSDWANNELLAYNIVVKDCTDDEFFGVRDVPIFRFSEDRESRRVLDYLDLASKADQGQESAIDDFAKELLRILGYEREGTLLRNRFAIPLEISGDSRRKAQTDLCLVHKANLLLLLLQEDKTEFSSKNPEPQVIAEAIAAFQFNNKNRRQNMDKLEDLEEMIFPCITMVGTFPRFYLVPVTRELNECVMTGQYPHHTTTVLRYVPRIEGRRKSEGMVPKDNMEEILRCYSLFRETSEKNYSKFLV
jgi:hypothetical protein